MIDKVLGGVGLAMAAFATFFPWYALLHQGEFSMPSLWQAKVRTAPQRPGHEVVAVSPLAMPEADDELATAIDQLTTATVPGPSQRPAAKGDDTEAGLDQPFPASPGFRLMHVVNGRALIEDASGMYVVRVGSTLPDNSRLATFEQRDGRWVMITSKGEVYEAN